MPVIYLWIIPWYGDFVAKIDLKGSAQFLQKHTKIVIEESIQKVSTTSDLECLLTFVKKTMKIAGETVRHHKSGVYAKRSDFLEEFPCKNVLEIYNPIYYALFVLYRA